MNGISSCSLGRRNGVGLIELIGPSIEFKEFKLAGSGL